MGQTRTNQRQGMGQTTRGGLVPAKIYEVNDDGSMKQDSKIGTIYCVFNPSQYSITIHNAFMTKGLDENANFGIQYDEDGMNPRRLTLNELWFDTYEEPQQNKRDVRQVTDRLLACAEPRREAADSGFKLIPPRVAFEWGPFRFLAVIESLRLDFVLFDPDGTPVRAKAAHIRFIEFKYRHAHPRQNPSSGDGPTERMWRVTAGDRLDLIAMQVYEDATKWRLIAAHNQIEDPFLLRNGMELAIPEEE